MGSSRSARSGIFDDRNKYLIRAIDKRIEIIKKIAAGAEVDKERAEVEKIESFIGDDPLDVLYSDKTEGLISYRQKVLEIESDKDDFLFSLAGHKGETIETLGRKTLSEIMSFAERITQEYGRH